MARPRLYKTEEERLEAARRYNRKYYEKYNSCTNSRLNANERRNKKAIGLKMAMNYRHKRDNTKSKHRDFASTSTAPKLTRSPSPPAYENCVIYNIKDAQSHLVVISAKLEALCIKMVQDFQDNREAVQACLSQHLQTLERIQEYLRSANLDDNHHPNASDPGRTAAVGVMCRHKAITMATEELWCYSATREIDEEMPLKYIRGAQWLYFITDLIKAELRRPAASKGGTGHSSSYRYSTMSINMVPASKPQPTSIKKKKPLWEVQDEFLQKLSPEYFRIRDEKDRVVFFNNLFARFFARWPEEQTLFPGVTRLSAEQAVAVARSVKRHEKVGLYRWFKSAERRRPRHLP
ncbi:hypothetical protein EV424DRAFT_1539732 [Suillus variegatus]|nr:hypothetical protein EV424DRAFT_1539732 [Suillus variegatus]